MAATNTNIKINIVEPGSSTPVDPATGTTEISAPDTGLFTHSIGGPEATAIGVVLILTIAAIIATILYRKQKKAGKVTKLVRTIEQTKTIIKSKKRITAGLTAPALLASVGTLTTLLANAGKSNTNAAEGDNDLTLDVSSEDLTIEVGDTPVFAVLPVELTVEEATPAGYTLTTYTTSTDIVSTTNPNNKIPMIALVEDELTALEDNTWGLALDNEPASKDNEVYTVLSTDQSNPTILKSIDDYSETEANDKTTIYYGFYITPDVPKGTYEGSAINYEAEPNYITNLSFNGNGNDGGVDMEGMTIIAGDTITLPANTYTKEGYNFMGWNTVATPTEQDPGEAYADQAEYTAIEGETKDVTLYAQWEEATLYMQDVATWGSKLEIGDEIIAVDNRDNKEYYVARLADGNIWMTQNLDHDIGDIEGGTYTSADTDLAYSSFGITWTPSSDEYTKQTGDTSGDSSIPQSYDPGDLYWNGAIIYNQETCETNGGTWLEPGYRPSYCDGANPTASTGDGHYHIGNYYDWGAAVAMSDFWSYGVQLQDANQSICPAGWRLPIYEGDKSYQNLVDALNLTSGVGGNIQNASTHFVYGGNIYGGGAIQDAGSSGYYWSDIAEQGGNAYFLGFSATNDNPNSQAKTGRHFTKSLRCVAR